MGHHHTHLQIKAEHEIDTRSLAGAAAAERVRQREALQKRLEAAKRKRDAAATKAAEQAATLEAARRAELVGDNVLLLRSPLSSVPVQAADCRFPPFSGCG